MGSPTFLHVSEYSGSMLGSKCFLRKYEWASLERRAAGQRILGLARSQRSVGPGSVNSTVADCGGRRASNSVQRDRL